MAYEDDDIPYDQLLPEWQRHRDHTRHLIEREATTDPECTCESQTAMPGIAWKYGQSTLITGICKVHSPEAYKEHEAWRDHLDKEREEHDKAFAEEIRTILAAVPPCEHGVKGMCNIECSNCEHTCTWHTTSGCFGYEHRSEDGTPVKRCQCVRFT